MMEQVCPVVAGISRPNMVGRSDEVDRIYNNVRLIGPDMDKLVALCDALLFYCQVARLRTRPVKIQEAEGCLTLTWSRYAPAVFRNSRMPELIAGGALIEYLTVQESRAQIERCKLPLVAQTTVFLEWTFTPPNYFEEPIEIRCNDYAMSIADGKAEARIDAEVFDRDPAIRKALHDGLNDRFLGAQLLTHQLYTLSKPSMVRIDPDGKRNIFLELESIVCVASVGTPDLIVTDKDGNVVIDTRKDRIEKKKTVAEVIQQHRATDTLLDALLKSYQASVNDPDNELAHLYEVRDALSKKFGDGDAVRAKLGITRGEWSRFGQLANDEPLRQGRHRGTNAGNLRDATEGELQEARSIGRKMIEAYLGSL